VNGTDGASVKMPYNSYAHHWPVLAFFKGDAVSFVDASSLNVLEHLG
jgi:hypothetical protein